jgi:hypothetical protein
MERVHHCIYFFQCFIELERIPGLDGLVSDICRKAVENLCRDLQDYDASDKEPQGRGGEPTAKSYDGPLMVTLCT